MTTKASTGLRNHMLTTGSLKAALDGGFLRLYSGVEPATADAAIPVDSTLLLTVFSDNVAAGLNLAATAADGFIEKSAQTWSGTVLATGTATWFRFVAAGDTGALSTTQARLQGSVARAGADLNISSADLVAGAPQAVNYFTVALPAM